MRVMIITEGGSKTGFGHLTRCISLYDAFRKRGLKVEFVINADDAVRVLLKGTKYRIFNWLEGKDVLCSAIKNYDVVVVDSYLAGVDIYRRISKIARICLYIDDNRRIDYPDGIVLNGNIYADTLGYPKSSGLVYLAGPKYMLLRKEFWGVPHKKKIGRSIRSVFISLGGTGRYRMLRGIAELFVADRYKGMYKRFVIGADGGASGKIKRLGDERVFFLRNLDAAAIKRAMLRSDVAVSAGGQTLHELLRVGVPTVAIAAAENQLDNVKAWQKRGVVEYAGCWKDAGLPEKVLACFENLKEQKARLKRSLEAKKIIDGKGAVRVVQRLLSI